MSAAAPTDPPGPEEGSLKPYLLRALYEWALDHGLTPQVLVDVNAAGAADEVVVPAAQVKDGRIALNIHPRAVARLEMGNDCLHFSARFGGKEFAVRVPVAAVSAIFCRENGQGIAFQTGPDGGAQGAGVADTDATVTPGPAANTGAMAKPAKPVQRAKTGPGKTAAAKRGKTKPRKVAHLKLVK